MLSRRKFLAITGAVAVSAALPGSDVSAVPKKVWKVHRYTGRFPWQVPASRYQYVFRVGSITEFYTFIQAADKFTPNALVKFGDISERTPQGYVIKLNGYLSPREFEFLRKYAKKHMHDGCPCCREARKAKGGVDAY